jgi:hypothetical protein
MMGTCGSRVDIVTKLCKAKGFRMDIQQLCRSCDNVELRDPIIYKYTAYKLARTPPHTTVPDTIECNHMDERVRFDSIFG